MRFRDEDRMKYSNNQLSPTDIPMRQQGLYHSQSSRTIEEIVSPTEQDRGKPGLGKSRGDFMSCGIAESRRHEIPAGGRPEPDDSGNRRKASYPGAD